MYDNIDNAYWDKPRIIDNNIFLHAIGLVEYKNAIKETNSLLDYIENLDIKIENNKTKTVFKNWSKWKYDSKNDSKYSLCFAKPVPFPNEIDKNDLFYNEQYYISSILHGAIDDAILKYYDVYPRSETNVKSKERFTRLLKFIDSDFMPSHSDHGTTSRVISAILYLNENYDGGELHFPYLDITIKPSSGSVILFPSNFIYTHEVKKITSGTRYSFPNWFHNINTPNLKEINSSINRQTYE